jgi:hypothetical protein
MLCWVVEKITEAGEMVWVERPARFVAETNFSCALTPRV